MPRKPSYHEQRIISHDFIQYLLASSGIDSPINIGRTIYGKPQLRFAKKSLNFNISHSENITVGVTHCLPVGIDVEAKDRRTSLDDEYLFYEFFKSKPEASRAFELNTFIELWTIKEAVLKASGYGLWGGLKNISVKMQNRNHGYAYFGSQKYQVNLSTLGRFSVAMAIFMDS